MTGSIPPAPVPVVLARTFAPVHKRVMGTAVGTTAALAIFLLTVYHVVAQPRNPPPLELLGQVFYGYEVTWLGSLIGAWWAFVAGFVGGWFAAFLRNLIIAVWRTSIKIRAHLTETRGFLDQI